MNIFKRIGEAIETDNQIEAETRAIIGLYSQLQVTQGRRLSAHRSHNSFQNGPHNRLR